MTFLKQNWFKISLLVVILVGFYILSDRQKPESQRANLGPTLSETLSNSGPLDNETSSGTSIITGVIDGDTIKLSSGQLVRLIGIDAPEGNEPFYSESKNKLSNLILNKEVKLEKDVSEVDRYARLLRYIFIGDTFINLEMIKQGYAIAYKYPPDTKYSDLFSQAEVEAKNNSLGMWSKTSTPIPTKQTIPSQSNFYLPACASYDCDCPDFSSHAHAQWFHENYDPYDAHRLDRDGDGLACESI